MPGTAGPAVTHRPSRPPVPGRGPVRRRKEPARLAVAAGIAALLGALLSISAAPTQTVLAALPTPPPGTTAPNLAGPQLTPDPATPGATVAVAAVAASIYTIVSAEYSVDAGPWTAMSATDGAFDSGLEGLTASLIAPASGTPTVCVRATDSNGGTSSGSACAVLTVSGPTDTTPPTVTTPVLVPDPAASGATVTVTSTATDPSGVASGEVRVDGGPWTAMRAADGAFGGTNEDLTGSLGGSVLQIAAGYAHTCALLAGGGVACWGNNFEGELGNGTTTNSSTPLAVSVLTGASAIAAGSAHTCALLAGGNVACWGYNGSGQLGNGTTTNSSSPVTVSGLTGATAIAASEDHACALLSGSVACWGDNSAGQLGDGTATDSPSPVAVSGITTATAIAAGQYHTCAVLSSGSVDCWGWNSFGQLGDGTYTDSSSPVAVSGITTAIAIAAGYAHTCALLASGGVACWGYNGYGQLGDGTYTDSLTSVPVSGITGANAIAAGYGHTCALLTGGAAACWGSDGYGELGDGTTANSPTPVAVSALTGATVIAAGDAHTCAVVSSGSVECWGWNAYGQLGDGTTADSPTPVLVNGTGSLSGGAHIVCIRATDGLGNVSDGSACATLDVSGSTPTGTNVDVVPSYVGGTSPVDVTFGTVTAPGTTTLTTSTTAPTLAGGFAIGSPPLYYDLQTTAIYSGTVTVCISYAGITPAPTSLLHYDSGLSVWVNITSSIDTTTQVICGDTTSLSPFALVTLTYSYPTRGAFVVGDGSAAVGATVTWWSPRWSSTNMLSGGTAPSAFKGFASSLSSTPPTAGGAWSTSGGQSANPPATVPTYMAVIVTSAVSRSGAGIISGTDTKIAVVQVLPGYNPVTGTPGTGRILGFLP